MRIRHPCLASSALLLLLAAPAAAHDFLIEPSTFTPGPPQPVSLRLLVGERFAGEGVPRSDAIIVRFTVAAPGGEARVQGRDGSDPAGMAVVGAPGLYVAGYRSRPSTIEVEPG